MNLMSEKLIPGFKISIKNCMKAGHLIPSFSGGLCGISSVIMIKRSSFISLEHQQKKFVHDLLGLFRLNLMNSFILFKNIYINQCFILCWISLRIISYKYEEKLYKSTNSSFNFTEIGIYGVIGQCGHDT